MPILFAKYVGCGNDFIVIDNRKKERLLSQKAISHLCHRHCGIGADGLILLNNGTSTPYRMRIFNADGSEAEMCGNGLRCLAHYIYSLDPHPRRFSIETMNAVLDVTVEGGTVSVTMPPALDISHKTLKINGKDISLHTLDTGVPHAVIFVDEFQESHLSTDAPAIRHHPDFPKGTNVNYAKILPCKGIAVRTYERGVEKETLACGTGAVAVALTAASNHNIPSPVTVHTRSGENLQVKIDGSTLLLTGPATKVFEGLFHDFNCTH